MSETYEAPAGPGGRVPQAAVSAFIRDPTGTRILLAKRGAGPAAGRWAFPGGRIEPGERARDALRREILEETGLDVAVGDLIDFADAILPDRHFVILVFSCTVLTGTPRAADDAAELIWASPQDAAALPLTPGTWQTLRRQGFLAPSR